MVDVICPPLSISSIVVSLWLAGCLAKSTLIGWREYYSGGGVGVDRHLCGAQQTRAFDPMLFQYWPLPLALDQHWNSIGSSLRVCWESCPHFDTRVPSVSGRNRQHSALCTWVCTPTWQCPMYLLIVAENQCLCSTQKHHFHCQYVHVFEWFFSTAGQMIRLVIR